MVDEKRIAVCGFSARAHNTAMYAVYWNTAFPGTPEPSEQLLDEVSPARHLNVDTPPAFPWAASEDDMVQARDFYRIEREDKAGISYADFIVFQQRSFINAAITAISSSS